MFIEWCQFLFLICFLAYVTAADVLVQTKHDNETIIACTNDSECELATKWLFWLLMVRCRKPVKDGNDQEAICVEEVNMQRINVTLVALSIFLMLCVFSVCCYVQLENRRFATAYAEEVSDDDNSSAGRKTQKARKHPRRKPMTSSNSEQKKKKKKKRGADV